MTSMGSFACLPSIIQRPSLINVHMSKNMLLKKGDSKAELGIRSRMVNKCDTKKSVNLKNHIYLIPQDVQYTKVINTFGNPKQCLKNIRLILPMYNIKLSKIEETARMLGITKDESFLMWVAYSLRYLTSC